MSEERAGAVYLRAWERALRLLEASAKSSVELDVRLARAGFDGKVRAAVLKRLGELGLVDDASFARSYAARRATKGLGPAAIAAELEARGIDPHTARAAVAGVDVEAGALEAAAVQLRRLARLPIAQQGARLVAHLVRRGFEPELAEATARRVLPPEGWD
jgi:regulatory protein